MAYEIKVPRLGWNMDEGVFIEWLVREGERIEPGRPLFALEGDKAVAEVEALDGGVLRVGPGGPVKGQTVKVGEVIGYLAGQNEPTPSVKPPTDIRPPSEPASAPATAPSSSGGTSLDDAFYPPIAGGSSVSPRRFPEPAGGSKTISPRAARLAASLGIDWRELVGTGRTGRVRERDVRARSGGITDA